MARVYVCYRREDTKGYAGRIYDRLTMTFGRGNVFLDVGAIRPGADFVDAINTAIEKADALLALIGKDWLELRDEDSSRRIDNPDDYVRLEIDAALERGIRVIPILIHGASMPGEEELPIELEELVRLQALELNHSQFEDFMTHLISELRDIGGEPAPDPLYAELRELAETSRRAKAESAWEGSLPALLSFLMAGATGVGVASWVLIRVFGDYALWSVGAGVLGGAAAGALYWGLLHLKD